MRTSVPARIGTWVVALVIGAVYGLAGTIGHAYTLWWIPVGLVVGIVGCAALLLAVRLLTGDRWATLATGLGMMLVTIVFTGAGPGGSVVVPQTTLAVVWTFAVPLLVVVAVAWPDRIGPAPNVTASSDGSAQET